MLSQLPSIAAYLAIPTGWFSFILLQSVAKDGLGGFEWAGLGVGGILAGVMFYFYRQDRIQSEARLIAAKEASETRLVSVIQDQRSIIQDQRIIIKEITAALTSLTDSVSSLKAIRQMFPGQPR